MGVIPSQLFPYGFFLSKISMGTEQSTAIKISSQALEFIAASGGHATLYLVPRPAADG
jgi:hypothetical protein